MKTVLLAFVVATSYAHATTPPAPASKPATVNSHVNNHVQNSSRAQAAAQAKSSASANSQARQNQSQRQTQALQNTSSPVSSSVATSAPSSANNSYSNYAPTSVVQTESRRPVSQAYAPSIHPTSDCTTSVGLGLSGVGASGSFGASSVNENCERRALAMMSAGFGDIDTAEEILCDDTRYRHARQRAGRPCATVELTAEQKAIYSGNDNIVRYRYELPLVRD